jgi:hypothetical protein
MRRVFWWAMLLSACEGVPEVADAGGHRASEALRACAVAGSVSTAPALMQHLNALPHPVSIPCAVASLPRPLAVVATTSLTSAQPAANAKNPRIFVVGPGVVLSVVPDGPGMHLLELGEWVTPLRTLKGELEFPLTQPLTGSEPFTRVMYQTARTTCGLCHREETPSATVASGYTSLAYRPSPDSTVAVSALQTEHQACIASGESSERCELFHALFDFGDVVQGAFEQRVALFVQ